MKHALSLGIFALFVLCVLSCAPSGDSGQKPRMVPREEIFAASAKIAELHKGINDENRCVREREMNRLYESVCSDCYDGWGLQSHSFDEKKPGCDIETVDTRCIEEPWWIGRKVSSCGTCGISYSAASRPTGDTFKAPFDDYFRPLTCEEYYTAKKKKEKYCGKCLRIGAVN